MNLIIRIDDRVFLPVAAVPYITHGKMKEAALMAMLVTAAHGPATADAPDLEIRTLLPIGTGWLAPRTSVEELKSAFLEYDREKRFPIRTMATMLIAEEGLAAHMRTSEYQSLAERLGVSTDEDPILDLEPEVPWSVAVQLWAQLPLAPKFDFARKNGRDGMAERIEAAMTGALESLAKGGIELDRQALPGRKVDWLRVLQHLDRKISLAPGTIDRYFRDLGFRFGRGARAAGALPILQHFGLSPE